MVSLIKSLFWVSRPISWVNTAYPFLAAYLISGGRQPVIAVLGTLFFLIPYNLMMYGVNDVFDYESDIRNPRKGGVEGAVAARQLHRPILIAVIITNLPFLMYLGTLGTASARIWLSYLVFMVIAYSAPYLRFKERPVLDSFTSATHFASPMVYGFLLTGWHASFIPATIAFFAWGMASHAFGAVQDILPDREGSIASIATILGARATILFVSGLYLLAGVVLLAYGWPGAIAALAVIPYIHNALRFVGLTDATSPRAHAGWQRFLGLNFIAGFIITLLLIGKSIK
jgi:4-hydroxybenzoate polyprenyltransferase